MKILFLAPRFNKKAGDGVYALNLAKGLINNGITVDIISFDDNSINHIKFDYFSKSFFINNRLAIHKNFFSSNYYSYRSKRFLKIIIDHLKPDCVHVHGIHQYFTISCLILLKKYKIPIIFTVHDYKVICGNSGFYSGRTNEPCTKCLKGKQYPILFERCKNNSLLKSLGIFIQMSIWKYTKAVEAITYFHSGSFFVKNLLGQNEYFKDKIKYIRFPIIKNKVNSINLNEIDIAYIGRFVPHKGIKIFAEAVKDFTNKIHVFGAGPEEYAAKNILKNNELVEFHGWKKYEEIYQIIGEGSIVVVPYLAYETFCYVVLEAMVNGGCVIASNRGAISELIQSGYNGILINEPTSENFTSEIKKLLEQPEKIYSLGQEACKISSTLTSFDTHAVEVANLYSEAVKNQKLIRKQ